MGRHRAMAEVPELGGLSVRAAEDAVLDSGLLPHHVTPGSRLTCSDRRDCAVVCGQEPRPHTRTVTGARVCFWCGPTEDDPPNGGGGGGSRRPRGPRPLLPTGHKPF
jgi:hypothetical protein